MKLVTFHPDAHVEITEAARYFEARKSGLGSDLLDEVNRALDQVLANPEAFVQIGMRARRKSLWRFPYNLIYAEYSNRIRIVAFAHQKRRPFYWRMRTEDDSEEEA